VVSNRLAIVAELRRVLIEPRCSEEARGIVLSRHGYLSSPQAQIDSMDSLRPARGRAAEPRPDDTRVEAQPYDHFCNAWADEPHRE
jgi:hypothetical protein